jgi:cytochrome c1
MRKFLTSTLAAALLAVAAPAMASEGPAVEHQSWSWNGPFGQFDKAQLRRGFQVYREICSNCHSMKLVAYRNLGYLGFNEDEIKAIAAEKQVQDGPNDQGDMYMRPARPSDRLVPPFPNEPAARVANNGALPPDLSLITKARTGGGDYVFAVLTGFRDAPPDGVTIPDGMFYNAAFPGHAIAMPPPISDDQVTYADGTKATKEQIAKDAVAYLTWAAEPEMDQRHSLGIKTLIFVFVMTCLFYALKRRIWAKIH